MHFDINKHMVYLARHGSMAYGTNLPESDVDTKGFAVSPKKFVLGFAFNFEQHQSAPRKKNAEGEDESPEAAAEDDTAIYDVRKFCRLAANCNPAIIEVLFVEDEDVLQMHPAGRLIREHRDLFLSRKARHTFSGYAISQLKRIKTHRGYLLNPPTHKPTRQEYGLGVDMKITPDMMGAFDKLAERGETANPNVMELVQQEKRYRSALNHWNQHENWKATRNEKRAALEAKHGYDTKHGMHLVRLLRMCKEILEGKGVIVRRPDAQELLGIRRGEWPYDKLVEWAERQDAEMQALYQASTLRHAPDMEKLNDLCVEAQELYWRDV